MFVKKSTYEAKAQEVVKLEDWLAGHRETIRQQNAELHKHRRTIRGLINENHKFIEEEASRWDHIGAALASALCFQIGPYEYNLKLPEIQARAYTPVTPRLQEAIARKVADAFREKIYNQMKGTAPSEE